MPGALGPEHVDYVFNHTGDYLFIIHIQGGASTSFLATVDVELEGEEFIPQPNYICIIASSKSCNSNSRALCQVRTGTFR